VNIPIIVPDAF